MREYPKPYAVVPMQKFVFESDYLPDFLTVLHVAARTAFKQPKNPEYRLKVAVSKQAVGLFENGSEYVDGKFTAAKYLHICTLLDYQSAFIKGDEVFGGNDPHTPAILAAGRLLDKATLATLKEGCGDGYHYGFEKFDGSVELGYRVAHRPSGGWNRLDVSLCHIYYGK